MLLCRLRLELHDAALHDVEARRPNGVGRVDRVVVLRRAEFALPAPHVIHDQRDLVADAELIHKVLGDLEPLAEDLGLRPAA